MKSFTLYNNRVEIVKNDGTLFTIYFNENSGKVYFRYKIGTISQVKHPGIFLGVDVNGVGYFLHNHYHYGKAHITTQTEFVQGMPLYIYNEKCSNTPLKVIEIGLNEILRGESYRPVTYNCQTLQIRHVIINVKVKMLKNGSEVSFGLTCALWLEFSIWRRKG